MEEAKISDPVAEASADVTAQATADIAAGQATVDAATAAADNQIPEIKK